MTPEQSKTVEQVYDKFMEGEATNGWDCVDDQMVYLDYLDDGQLMREAASQRYEHTVTGTVKCSQEFCDKGCYVQTIVDAVGYILALHEFSTKQRYVLEQYLALSQLGYIVRVPN